MTVSAPGWNPAAVDSSQLSSWDPTATVPSSGPGVAVEEVESFAPPGLEEFYDADVGSYAMQIYLLCTTHWIQVIVASLHASHCGSF